MEKSSYRAKTDRMLKHFLYFLDFGLHDIKLILDIFQFKNNLVFTLIKFSYFNYNYIHKYQIHIIFFLACEVKRRNMLMKESEFYFEAIFSEKVRINMVQKLRT